MLLFSLIVAGSNSFGKLIAHEIDPAVLTAVRFLLAAVLLGAVLAATGRLKPAHYRAAWRYLPLGGAYAAFFVLMFEALKTTNPVSTAAIFTLMPFIAALLARLLSRTRNSGFVWGALWLGATGALWVVFGGSLSALLALDLGRGEFLFLIGTASHAAYAVLVPKLRRGEPVYAVALGVTVSGAVILTVLFFPRIAATDWAGLSMTVWLVLVYLAVLASIVTMSLITLAAARLPAAKVTAYTYLTPFWVVVMEPAFGRAVPDAAVLLGGLPIFAALLILFYERS
jgi:drug/metabolite transporter (DMT)-like permease